MSKPIVTEQQHRIIEDRIINSWDHMDNAKIVAHLSIETNLPEDVLESIVEHEGLLYSVQQVDYSLDPEKYYIIK